jgi:hydrogenase nickel incorporation protein HypA/HybF
MHEFSLAMEVINLVQREAEKNKVNVVQEIEIEVGELSGIEADAFETALGLLVKDSILDKAKINIVKTPGKGRCNACNYEFIMNHRLTTCSKCKSFPSEISGGDEFRVISLLVE